MMIGLEVWKFTNLHSVCDDDKPGSLHVYTFCVMMVRSEVYKFTCLHVYMLCVMMISLQVYKFTSLHIVCDDDKFGSL